MAEAKVFVNRPPSSSSPPNCAICLGSCANKCFSDSCMHEFCFKCLLQWSKIKAECPLCKQPFKRIIHNVKSNEEYEEHVVETQRNEDLINLLDNTMPDEFFIVPPTLHQLPTTHPHRHEFHVRTTFTVDSRGEQAVQHMLLTHPLTAGGRITIGANYHHPNGPGSSRTVFPTRHRPRDFSATSFRRSIYAQNLWVNTLPDFTGRYRDVSPQFFRNNPAARQRLVPWLNRELNAILYENTQLIMHLVDLILETLLHHHICSRHFRNLLQEYLDMTTNHFVHEFYSFMRSPFDMVGYDRNVIYTTRPQSPAPFLEDETVELATSDDDSDVVIVGSSNPSQPVTISLVETDSDEPELVSQTDQIPMPFMPCPKREDSPCGARPAPAPPVQSSVVNLPPKLRHKHHKVIQDKEKHKEKSKRHRAPPRISSEGSSTEELVDRSEHHRRRKRKKLRRKHKKRNELSVSAATGSSSSDTEVNVTSSDTDEDEKPLIDVLKKRWKSRNERHKKKKSRLEPSTLKSKYHYTSNEEPSCSRTMPGELLISNRNRGESSRTNRHEEPSCSSTNIGESSYRNHTESRRTNEEPNSNTNLDFSSRTNGTSRERKSNKNRSEPNQNGTDKQLDWYSENSSNTYGGESSTRTHHSEPPIEQSDSRTNRSIGYLTGEPSSSSRTQGHSSGTDRTFPGEEPIGTIDTVVYGYADMFRECSRGGGGVGEPMDLSVPVSLTLPWRTRSRSPESTTPPLPYYAGSFSDSRYPTSSSSNWLLNSSDTRGSRSTTPPPRASPENHAGPSESGSATEETSPFTPSRYYLESKDTQTESPVRKPLVLKREKNNKWYVWAESDGSSSY